MRALSLILALIALALIAPALAQRPPTSREDAGHGAPVALEEKELPTDERDASDALRPTPQRLVDPDGTRVRDRIELNTEQQPESAEQGAKKPQESPRKPSQ